jgi:pilus assembly protein CpaB
MNSRTLIVVFAAMICGGLASVGVYMVSQKSASAGFKSMQVVAAKIDIPIGQEITENMLTHINWYSENPPANTYKDFSEVVGMYAIMGLDAGDLINQVKIAETATTLLPAEGKFAFTIETRTASSNVGKNLVPGNRVDILWTTMKRSANAGDGMPVSCRLLQNIKVLAVGQVKDEADMTQKSITLEVAASMDENLSYAQVYGELSLSLRHPGNEDNVQPSEITNLRTVMEDAIGKQEAEKEAKEKQQVFASAVQPALENLSQFGSHVSGWLTRANSTDTQQGDDVRTALKRIGKGMRGITIQTPMESTALGGILEPGDRVDLVLTLQEIKSKSPSQADDAVDGYAVASATLIENIEILAIDSNVELVEGNELKKMSNSVSLIVKEEMSSEISRAGQTGILSLVLRGENDSLGGLPSTVITVSEFLEDHVSSKRNEGIESAERVVENPKPVSRKMRVIRGNSVQDVVLNSPDIEGFSRGN